MITYKVIYVSLKSKIVVKFYVHISPVFSCRVTYDKSAFYKIKHPISYFSEWGQSLKPLGLEVLLSPPSQKS